MKNGVSPYSHQVTNWVNGVPCNAQYINWGGFITIPFLALTAFTIIIFLMTFIKLGKNAEK